MTQIPPMITEEFCTRCGRSGGIVLTAEGAEEKPYDGVPAGECWIETFNGLRFHLLEPQIAEISMLDIAHSLARLCRFTGHTRAFYSVAQHSVLASCIVPPEDAAAALLHDAAEAYMGDLSRPLKLALGPRVKEIEENIRRTIFEAFGLPPNMPPSVKQADVALLLAEKRDLMTELKWTRLEMAAWEAMGAQAYAGWINPWGTEHAEGIFVERFVGLLPRAGEGHGWGV